MAETKPEKARYSAMIFVGTDMEEDGKRADKLEYCKVLAEKLNLDVVSELEDVSKEEFLTQLHEFLLLPSKRKHIFYVGKRNGFSCNDEMVSTSVCLATVLTSEELIQEEEEESDDEEQEKLPPKQNTRVLKFHLFNEYTKDWYGAHAEYMKLQNMYGGPAIMADFVSDKKVIGVNTSATAV